MNVFFQLAAVGGLAVAAAGTSYWVKGPPARAFICDPATLKPDEICLAQIPSNASILWVDGRSRTEWKATGLVGSVLWNLDPAENRLTFEAETAMRIMEKPRVIVYCGDENCGISHQVAGQIRNLGLGAEVSILKGGWRALDAAGLIP
ncbi:MAG: rhodanese-like domain-containing protein [Akkermansiaceae bacterium]